MLHKIPLSVTDIVC